MTVTNRLRQTWWFLVAQVENVLLVGWELCLFIASRFDTILMVAEFIAIVFVAISLLLY